MRWLVVLLLLSGTVQADFAVGTEWKPDESGFIYRLMHYMDFDYIELFGYNFTVMNANGTDEQTLEILSGIGEINIINITSVYLEINTSTLASTTDVEFNYYGLNMAVTHYALFNATGLYNYNITPPNTQWFGSDGYDMFYLRGSTKKRYGIPGGGEDNFFLVIIVTGAVIMFGGNEDALWDKHYESQEAT